MSGCCNPNVPGSRCWVSENWYLGTGYFAEGCCGSDGTPCQADLHFKVPYVGLGYRRA